MNKIEKARKVMRDAFKKDPDFRHGYEANIAMLIYDDQTGDHLIPVEDDKWTSRPAEDLKTKDGCGAIADRVIDLVFGK